MCSRSRAYLAAGVAFPTPREGIEIIVDPREDMGLVRTSYKARDWDAGSYYCLQVRRDGDRTTVVVHLGGAWIK